MYIGAFFAEVDLKNCARKWNIKKKPEITYIANDTLGINRFQLHNNRGPGEKTLGIRELQWVFLWGLTFFATEMLCFFCAPH